MKRDAWSFAAEARDRSRQCRVSGELDIDALSIEYLDSECPPAPFREVPQCPRQMRARAIFFEQETTGDNRGSVLVDRLAETRRKAPRLRSTKHGSR